MSEDARDLKRLLYVMTNRYTSGLVWIPLEEIEQAMPDQLTIDPNNADGGFWIDIRPGGPPPKNSEET